MHVSSKMTYDQQIVSTMGFCLRRIFPEFIVEKDLFQSKTKKGSVTKEQIAFLLLLVGKKDLFLHDVNKT